MLELHHRPHTERHDRDEQTRVNESGDQPGSHGKTRVFQRHEQPALPIQLLRHQLRVATAWPVSVPPSMPMPSSSTPSPVSSSVAFAVPAAAVAAVEVVVYYLEEGEGEGGRV